MTIRVFKVKDSWTLRVKVTRQLSEGVAISAGEVYRLNEDGTEEKVEPHTHRSFICNDDDTYQKIVKVIEVVKLSGEAAGAWTSAISGTSAFSGN